MSQNGKGALLSLLAFGIYATSDALVKQLGEDYSPFQLIFFSFDHFTRRMLLVPGEAPCVAREDNGKLCSRRDRGRITRGACGASQMAGSMIV